MDRNPFICLAIIVSLATVAVVGMVGMGVIEYAGHPASQGLTAITSAAVGAIAGALAMSPHARGVVSSGKGNPTDSQPQVSARPGALPGSQHSVAELQRSQMSA